MPTDVDDEVDKLNPGDTDWARKTALDLHNMETVDSADEEDATERARSVLENPDSDPEAMRQAQETLLAQGDPSMYRPTPAGQNSGRRGFFARLGPGFKKYGASGGLAGLVIGATGLTGVALTPASALVALEKAITNDSSDATRTNISFRRAYMARLFSKSSKNNDKFKEAGKFAEKTVTMSPEQLARWEQEGFKLKGSVVDANGDPTGGYTTPEDTANAQKIDSEHRLIIDQITFPDGTTVDSGGAFNNYAENSVEGRRATSRVFEVRSAFFQDNMFKKILDQFKLVKSKRVTPTEEEDPNKRQAAENKAFDDNTGLKSETDPDKRFSALEENITGKDGGAIKGKVGEVFDKVTGGAGKAANLSLPVSLACATYNVARLTTETIKAKWIYDLISFAYPFVRAAAQLEDQGSIEPSVMENIMDRLTWADPDQVLKEDRPDLGLKKGDVNPTYGQTAFDSQGLKMAIYGDYTGLTEYAKKFTSWGWEAKVDMFANTYVQMAQTVLGGRHNVKIACKTAQAAQTVGMAQCLEFPLGTIMCGVGFASMEVAKEYLMPRVVEWLAQPAIHFLATVDLSSAMRGVGAGDAIAAGIGLLLEKQSMGAGMRAVSGPSKLKQVYQYITQTNNSYYAYITQPQIDDAKQHPFDANNQYSFTGQLASALSQKSGDGTLFSTIANLTSIVGKSFAKLPNTTANALFFQPSNMTLHDALGGDPAANRLGKCEDPDLGAENGIDAGCDWSGRTVNYTPPEILNGLDSMANGGGADIVADSLNYLHNENCTKGLSVKEKCIDDSGNPQDEFADWVKYCTDQRTDPMGTSSGAITDDDSEFQDGQRCIDKDGKETKMLQSFAVWYNWCYVQYATAERKTDCVKDQPEESGGAPSSSANSTCGDGSVGSIYDCALQFDPYGYQMGAGHPLYGTKNWYDSYKAAPPPPQDLKFDCSSLVMAAMVAAFGKDVGNLTAPAGFTGGNFERVPQDQGQKGDLFVQSGHVEIIKSFGNGQYTTFGAHTDSAPYDAQIGEAHYAASEADAGIWRYKGAGPNPGTGNPNA